MKPSIDRPELFREPVSAARGFAHVWYSEREAASDEERIKRASKRLAH
jgi:hypothetical protein